MAQKSMPLNKGEGIQETKAELKHSLASCMNLKSTKLKHNEPIKSQPNKLIETFDIEASKQA